MSLPQTFKALRSKGNGSEPKFEEVSLQKPGKNQVLVKMEYVPINPSVLVTINNRFTLDPSKPSPVGLEGSGTIIALGEDLKVPHNIGDKVHVLAFEPDGTPYQGTYAEYIIVGSETCPKMNEGMSLEEGSSIINACTVVYMDALVQQDKHKAIIHDAGSSALGRMLIRYFKDKEIKTINIVRRDEFIDELKKEGADYVLNSQSPDFETKLKEIAEKEQATISFDAIGGDFAGKLLKNQPKNSICYAYGALSGEDNVTKIPIMELFKGKRVAGMILFNYINERNQKGDLQDFFEEVKSLLPTTLNSQIQKVFKFEELKEALEYYQENSSKGKILLKLN